VHQTRAIINARRNRFWEIQKVFVVCSHGLAQEFAAGQFLVANFLNVPEGGPFQSRSVKIFQVGPNLPEIFNLLVRPFLPLLVFRDLEVLGSLTCFWWWVVFLLL
jgi:hypothetical protein